ncbi:serine/threonine-protein kinase bud32 [Naganishia albida]|nr:serine/threonine-protein kinase bud32 [Naganishia albida]
MESSSSPIMALLMQAELIKQGAEARAYKLPCWIPPPTVKWPSKLNKQLTDTTEVPQEPQPLLLKHRFPKRYRHPTLDANLTKSRIQAEARALARCCKAGIAVPGVRVIDMDSGILGMEWIDGWSVREMLGGGAEGEDDDEDEDEGEDLEALQDLTLKEQERAASKRAHKEAKMKRLQEAEGALGQLGISQEDLMEAIGTALAKMHGNSIVHGDLTTSNMMLRPLPGQTPNFELVLIDFGLSSMSTLQETLAVDLYVLERAFASTHPASEALFARVLDAYAAGLGEKKWKLVGPRLDAVRLRGRKRDMIG